MMGGKTVKGTEDRRKRNGTGKDAEGSGRRPEENLAEKLWEVVEGKEGCRWEEQPLLALFPYNPFAGGHKQERWAMWGTSSLYSEAL